MFCSPIRQQLPLWFVPLDPCQLQTDVAFNWLKHQLPIFNFVKSIQNTSVKCKTDQGKAGWDILSASMAKNSYSVNVRKRLDTFLLPLKQLFVSLNRPWCSTLTHTTIKLIRNNAIGPLYLIYISCSASWRSVWVSIQSVVESLLLRKLYVSFVKML